MLEVDVIGAALPEEMVREACSLAAASAGIEDAHVAVAFVDAYARWDAEQQPGPTGTTGQRAAAPHRSARDQRRRR